MQRIITPLIDHAVQNLLNETNTPPRLVLGHFEHSMKPGKNASAFKSSTSRQHPRKTRPRQGSTPSKHVHIKAAPPQNTSTSWQHPIKTRPRQGSIRALTIHAPALMPATAQQAAAPATHTCSTDRSERPIFTSPKMMHSTQRIMLALVSRSKSLPRKRHGGARGERPLCA
jgi:hypothetical protein